MGIVIFENYDDRNIAGFVSTSIKSVQIYLTNKAVGGVPPKKKNIPNCRQRLLGYFFY